ncbi:acyl-CoA N-acyltransferase [Thamnocephalis sphaerospora]|uniref:Acyl-CoA N-acyltransferase n=1 Tax=Thamnocephalis sphaerospora TaxID=78915 RepID=A0A4P9XTE1_9FUNG|nr:acyl-CoA N-acyltransferase [Thamnocephalis sphaerospora]|eukprot:RKP09444.1 acyl-CoA N-acyltransferase [Thamnocephalis sphaerospora]
MTSVRRFRATDLFKFNNVNLDYYTETYNISFYLQYLARWPNLFYAAEAPDGTIEGYIMGKTEGRGKEWHGHVTAVTVAPEYRRVGLAGRLMDILEDISENVCDGYFVDLFVRVSNSAAIKMYEKFGYVVYRRVLEYYSGIDGPDEDAFDMRKALKRDVKKESVIPLKHPVRPEDCIFF